MIHVIKRKIILDGKQVNHLISEHLKSDIFFLKLRYNI